MQWVPMGGMQSIFYLILYEKNFLGSRATACLLDLGICHFNALAVGMGGILWIWGCPRSDPPLWILLGIER